MEALAVDVTDESCIGEARRACARLARLVPLDEEAAGRLAVIVTEVATNLVRHGVVKQRILARTIPGRGVEVIAVDAGPGVSSITEALRDGYSTAGTQGTGLGAVRRMADDFDIWSRPDRGTVVLARVLATDLPARRVDVGCIVTALTGEALSGDAVSVHHVDGRLVILVCDGLGHGPDAAAAATVASRVFRESPDRSVTEHLRAIHEALAHTRGAAVAIADIHVDAHELIYAGVGNIAGSVTTPRDTRSFVSHDGIAGHMLHRVQEFTYSFPGDGILVMHSDGISQRWQLDSYPGITMRDPAIIAAVLHRDFSRARDDSSIVVARYERAH